MGASLKSSDNYVARASEPYPDLYSYRTGQQYPYGTRLVPLRLNFYIAEQLSSLSLLPIPPPNHFPPTSTILLCTKIPNPIPQVHKPHTQNNYTSCLPIEELLRQQVLVKKKLKFRILTFSYNNFDHLISHVNIIIC